MSTGRPLRTASPVFVGAGCLASCVGCEDGAEAGDETASEGPLVGATRSVVPGAMTRYSVVVTTTVFCPLPVGAAVSVTVTV